MCRPFTTIVISVRVRVIDRHLLYLTRVGKKKCGHAKVAQLNINLMACVKQLKILKLLEYSLQKLSLTFKDV